MAQILKQTLANPVKETKKNVIATRLVHHVTATHIASIQHRVRYTSFTSSPPELEVDFPVLTHRGISLASATYENFAER
jgi:hypothetical protein